ncbi:hypothetical protein O0I10_011039 [Lichtheimia ornata]|uniref:NADP-dependent oxidoreductase domain-containing protein n=1 Tax=Lichtheimia ornata TaxID=688661 RepID=A0AAD7UTH2_9FUNG|nr:uncharacterized protein O0I10_011039 [Lichtheimia ornata]KAJ8653289.1 hypothetical protein O0I10_011039 [Lichtheimia ornata]
MAHSDIKLNNGMDFPPIGFGTYGGPDAPEKVYEGAKVALEVGYRHIDTAFVYGTEAAVGKAIRESNVAPEEIFVVTKLWQTFHEPERVRPACERSLELLDLKQISQYLMHWPFSWKFTDYSHNHLKPKEGDDIPVTGVPFVETWKAMEQLVEDGLVKSIGVSNFTIPMLEELLKNCKIKPAVNQVEIHPLLPQEELLEFCNKNGIALTAYCPLSNPGKGKDSAINHPTVIEIAEKYKKTPGQVLLNWGMQRGYAVIPKSVTPQRIKDNFVQFQMDPEDVERITDIGRKGQQVRLCDPAIDFGPSNKIF